MITKTSPEAALTELSFINGEDAILNYFKDNFGGTDARFQRQRIASLLLDKTIPLVKCGVSHLTEYAMQWKAKQPKTTAKPVLSETTDFDALVGKQVKRTCGRIGTVTEHKDGKLCIELEDGSVRRPAAKRFDGLYTLVNA